MQESSVYYSFFSLLVDLTTRSESTLCYFSYLFKQNCLSAYRLFLYMKYKHGYLLFTEQLSLALYVKWLSYKLLHLIFITFLWEKSISISHIRKQVQKGDEDPDDEHSNTQVHITPKWFTWITMQYFLTSIFLPSIQSFIDFWKLYIHPQYTRHSMPRTEDTTVWNSKAPACEELWFS